VEFKATLDLREVKESLAKLVLQDHLEAVDQLELLGQLAVLEQLEQLEPMENLDPKG